FPRVLFGIIAGLDLAHTVFQERNGGVHLAPLAFRHDDTKRLHHVLQSLEAVAPITDDMHPADHAPGHELTQTGRDVRSAHVQKRADFLGIERARRDEQQGMNLGHGSIDAPGLAHLTPVKHELLSGRCKVHGVFRLDWSNDFYRNLTLRTSLMQESERQADTGRSTTSGPDWHAAKLRLTRVFFPIGFVALVRARSPEPCPNQLLAEIVR